MAGIAPHIALQHSLDRRRESGGGIPERPPRDELPPDWATVKVFFPIDRLTDKGELDHYLSVHSVPYRRESQTTVESGQNVRYISFDTTKITPEAVLAACKELGVKAKLDQTTLQYIGNSVRGLVRHVFGSGTTEQKQD